jgi:hypothetical protein
MTFLMDKPSLRLVAGFVAALALVNVDCRAADPVRGAFEILGLYALDQPANRHDLDNCFRSNDSGCLRAVAGERRAALTIFDQGPKVALNRVLDVLGKECASLKPHVSSAETAQPICGGAINSFYFFSTDAEDRAIVDRLRSLPEPTLRNVFVECDCFERDWILNRPERHRWIALIDDLRFLDKESGGREKFRNMFRNPPVGPTSGIDLVDPRADLPKWQADRLGVPR